MHGHGCGLGLFCLFFVFCLLSGGCSQVCAIICKCWEDSDAFANFQVHQCPFWGFDPKPLCLGFLGLGYDRCLDCDRGRCLCYIMLARSIDFFRRVAIGMQSLKSSLFWGFFCPPFLCQWPTGCEAIWSFAFGGFMSTYLVCLIRFGDSHFCSFVMVLSCLCILVSRNCHGLKEHLHVTRRQGSLSQGSARRQQASTLSLGTQCSFALRVLVLFALQCRIGEAMVPGPSQFEVGVCNPSGLPTKAHLLDAQNADISLVSETHLTVEGLRAFKKQLCSCDSSLKWIAHGSPTLPRTIGSDIGQWTGVACISKHPTRQLTPSWDNSLHQTARITCSTTFCSQIWITGVIVYGTPVGPTHPNARRTTSVLLDAAIDRVLQATGCRYIAGDWNGDEKTLPAITKLRRLGFQDVQDIEFSRTGRCPQATCRGKTRRDYMFLSPELARRFIQCNVDALAWSDHAAVRTKFHGNDGSQVRSLWPISNPLDWTLRTEHQPDVSTDFVNARDLEKSYRDFWKAKEAQVVDASKARGVTVPPTSLGRGDRCQPKFSNAPSPPVKIGRAGDLRPSFHGFVMMHLQWFRQLRRLQHYCRLAKAGPVEHSQLKHRDCLWKAVVESSGFKPSFKVWWDDHHKEDVDAVSISNNPPGYQVALHIFETFQADLRHLEKTLAKHRNHAIKLKRTTDINELYKGVRRDMPEQVDIFVAETKGTVAQVDDEFHAVELQEPVVWNDRLPIFHNGKELTIHHCEPDKLWLGEGDRLTAGDVLVQPSQIGNIDVLFEAFREQWNNRWNKHSEIPVDRWRVINDFAETVLPQGPISHLQCDATLLRSVVQSKKRTAATGLDSVSRCDLMACSNQELGSLVGIFQRAENKGEWPPQLFKGSVKSLAKVSSPSKVNHFRPITIFSLLYRCWSSVQSRHLLNALDSRLHPLLFGNRSNKRSADLWRVILDAVEEGHIHSDTTTGLVFDLEKAYNTLPRQPTLHALAVLGVPHFVLQAWAAALADIERFFVIQGQVSQGLFSNCGFAEGCGLSCLAMVAIDELYHQWMLRAHGGPIPLSFVDNWEVLLTDPQAAINALNSALSFARALDLSIDANKTYAWSTDSGARIGLRNAGFRVVSSERDLGAHVVYTKQIRNSTLKCRIQGLADFWAKLKTSGGTHSQRIRVVRTAAWPRALHGISGSFFGA